jgi:T5orf172 domain
MPIQKTRVPASPTVVRDLIPGILESEGALKRSEISAKLRQLLPLRGFSYDAGASVSTTKKALSQLLAAGLIHSPRTGWYEVTAANSTAGAEDGHTGEELSITDEQPPIEPDTRKLKIEREIGEGPESVYVYFHDVYFELAQRRGTSTWECKVGWTIGDPDVRIVGQGALTCFPRCPVIGLVIRTHDGRNLERLLHAALSYAGMRIKNGAGSEWFSTSPAMVEQWFIEFRETLKALKCNSAAS